MYTNPFDDAISVQEAARLLGVSRPTVYRLLETGRLTAQVHPVTGRKQLSRQQVAALAPAEGPAPLEDRVQDAGPSTRYTVAAHRGDGDDQEVEPSVDSIFRLPELALELPVDDLSERVDYYRFHGLPDDATSIPGHLRPDRGKRAE